MTMLTPLHEGWVLELGTNRQRFGADCPGSIAATVPGCVHLDLIAAGLIPDPYVDRNELAVRWIGEAPSTYRLRFTATPSPRAELAFEGIDGFATIVLNGTTLGRAENQ